jgi:hypothetical protein
MLDRAPSCAIMHNRNELKIYQGNIVYLNDGDNFELKFFNPTMEKIGIEINFNGIKKGDGYLVLNPGQDIILDRFLDEQRKMLFETYVINGENKDAVEAIQQNGAITFNFYKERYSHYTNEVKVNYNFPPKPFKYSPTIFNSQISGSSSSSSGIFVGYSPSNTTTTINNNWGLGYGQILTSSMTHNIYSEYVSENTSNTIDYSDYLADSFSDFNTTNKNSRIYDPLETGRIEKGDISTQTLKGVNLQFSEAPFHSVTYKLMPYSAMNKTVGEIRQYCSCCGYRLRKNSWDFCPKCGTKVQ